MNRLTRGPDLAARTVAPARHIVLLMHDFPIGGTERVAILLANAWVASGRDVTILCGSEQGNERARIDPRVRVRRVDPEIPRGPLSRLRLGRAMAAVLPSLAADVVLTSGNFQLPIAGAIGRCAVPVVGKLTNPLGTRDRGALGTALFRWATRRNVRRLDMLVAMSPALRDEAAAFVGHSDVRFAPQPILPSTTLVPASRPRGRPLRLLCAARLVPQKRVGLALRTLAELGDDFVLTLAGGGAEQAALQRQAVRLGIANRVRFLGEVAAIEPLLADHDLLLLTSAYEGYPAVMIEALAAGLPVVTTRSSPAMPEMLADPSFGEAVAADPVALAAAIRRVAAAPPPDPNALARLIGRHRIDRAAEAWLALLDGIVLTRRLRH